VNDEEQQAEIVINRSSSRDGGIGWSIRLVRRSAIWVHDTVIVESGIAAETDEEYTARCIAKHRELERELLLKTCCHDLDSCQENVKEASRE